MDYRTLCQMFTVCMHICRNLGAVEAMSITSLVGLSVDFCIHMSEAFNHAQATWTPDRDSAAMNACLSLIHI